jgi:NADH:ubiquinone oxidoreductase subunit F (NADH-binding)
MRRSRSIYGQVLLESFPYRIIEGMLIAGFSTVLSMVFFI